MATDLTSASTDDVSYPIAGDGASGRVKERIAIDIDSTMQFYSEMDEERLARGKRGEKMKFLSPSQLPVGINVLKILPPWTRNPPHAGRFWRAVWVHFGLGPAGETKTALCARRMNRLGLPKARGEDALGRCAVCEALEAIWAIPFEERTPEEKKFLSDHKARLNYLFNVVWLKGGGKSHVDEGCQILTCSPTLGEPILTAFKFVLSMKPTEVPDNFDVQIKKLPSQDKMFNGKPVYDYQEVYPSNPTVELDLDDPKLERYPLDAIYKPKEAAAVEQMFRQTACGAMLLGTAEAEPAERLALPPHVPAGASTPSEEDDIPFRHGPSEPGARPAAITTARAAVSRPAQLPLSREPGEDDLSDEDLQAMAARARAKKGASSRDQLAADLMRAARR